MPYVVDFWDGRDHRVPKDWEVCQATKIFKKGNASLPGNYRYVMKLVVMQKLVLVIIRQRLKVLLDNIFGVWTPVLQQEPRHQGCKFQS